MKASFTFSWPLFLAWFVLLELILGGGGRWISFGPLSPRMLLFGFVLLTLSVQLIRGKWHWKLSYLPLLLTFFSITAFSACWGWYRGASTTAIFTDVKPLLFWVNLAYLAYVFRDLEQLQNLKSLFKWSTFSLAAAYLILLVFWQQAWIDGDKMFSLLSRSEEFSFRGNLGFFYKGFVFLPIGMFFWFQESGKRKYFIILSIYLAILFTFTRGFWAVLFLIQLIYTIGFQPKNYRNWVVLAFMVLSLNATGYYVANQPKAYFPGQEGGEIQHNAEKLKQPLSETEKKISGAFKQGFEHRDASMIDRFVQIRQVGQAVSPLTLVLGHGLGHGVESRPIHMEISYLEVFHKQGLLGLGLWIGLFIALLGRYYKACGQQLKAVNVRSDSFVFFVSACFMFGISVLNPFINSPMGLGMLALSMVVLDNLAKKEVTSR